MLTGNQRFAVSIFVTILIVLGMYSKGYTEVTPVSERTSQVRDAIVAAVPGINSAEDVTETQLAVITSLNLRNVGITSLQSGDFSGLSGLTDLNLYKNELSSLPDGIFKNLAALTTLRLGGNTVNPFPLTVSLEKVGEDQFKAVAPTGAPFDIILPISAIHGSISDNATSLTIPKGSTESTVVTVSRTADTTAAVTATIGTLPSLPLKHYGYVLTKSNVLPLEILSAVTTTPPPVETPIFPPPIEPPTTNIAPVFTNGTAAIRSIAENTASGTNIGTAVSATDANEGDTLTYTLGGIDATSFDIDSTSGQLKTKSALDYETKRVYSITISVSDGSLTDTITVIVSVIDVDDTPFVSTILAVSDRTPEVRDAIVASVLDVSSANEVTDAHLAAITSLNLRSAGITELKSGDFSGMTGLTGLNLYGNMLNTLPMGIFEGVSSLNSLRLGGNLIDPLPLIVSVQQMDVSKFRAVVRTGAPFDILLPIGAMMVTIPKGSLTSAAFTALSTPNINALPVLPANHFGYVLAKSTVCNRTIQVSDAIVDALPGIDDCRNVSDVHLATITSLNLSNMSLTSLKTSDFAGMLSLTTLNLDNNQLSSLPDGIFDALTALTTVDLSGNFVSPLPLSISLQMVGSNQIKAVVPTGAPFDIVLPITVANGSSDGSVLTISTGNDESQTLTVTRTSGMTAAVTVDIALPSLPISHRGYALVKSNLQPLEVFEDINIAPVFTEGATATRTIAENTPVDTNIGNPISATDANNDTLTYSLSGTDATSFNIVSTTGQLKTKSAMDYETKTSYVVTVIVSDGELTDSIAVTINVTDVDETPNEEDTTTKSPDLPNTPPIFTEKETTTRSVAEDTSSGVHIGSAVLATDADDDVLTYSLSGTDASSFSIDSTSGQLRTSSSLDYENKSTYTVTITVSDGKGGSDSISVTINITDVDEVLPNNAPVFTDGDSTTRSVAEDTGSGVHIGSVVLATDVDDDVLTYSLSGTDASSFSIDSTNGQLRTDSFLDYETKSSYTVIITVSDGTLTDTITVTINITDVAETPTNSEPVFDEGSSTSRSVLENTNSGVDIGSAVSATDDDDGTLSYSLGGTDAASFRIDSSSGQISTSSLLNYESKDSYSVTITVSDGSLTSNIDVTIDVIDGNDAPEFSAGSSTSRIVAEDAAISANVGTAVSATDEDGDNLTYSLGGTDAASFSIDNTTGQLKSGITFNTTTKTTYSVIVTASDGNLTDTITVTITIRSVNDAPIFTAGNSATRAIAENNAVNANIGAAVSATDADNDSVTYTLGGTDAAAFSIVSTSGQLLANAPLNYESKDSYSVTITASDGNLTDTITITINITDANDAPVFSDGASTTRAIAENTGDGLNIGAAVSATDEDEDNLTYTLDGTDAAAFDIGSTTGQLQTKSALDFEDKNKYTVTVAVSDENGGTDTITVTINVTDLEETPANNPPVFTEGTSTTRSVAENSESNTNIGTPVAATDADNNTLAYLLGGTDAASFAIDSETGQLKTNAPIDHEDKDEHTVTVNVNDGSTTVSITVTINVTDANDAPIFTDGTSTTRSVAENTAIGVAIPVAIPATDQDGDELTYTLGGTDASSFSIVSTTGQLQTNAALNYESKGSYAVTITVSDGTLTDTIDVAINVTDANDAPIFTEGDSATRSVAENTSANTNIGTAVAATDPDDDDLTYTLGGTDASSFSIVNTSGQLQTSTSLDFETKTSYSVTISVSDGYGGTDSINVTINVTDINENRSPVFTDGTNTSRSVAENTASGQDIGSPVTATDPDDDDLTYTLGGTDATSFSIVNTSGQLQTKSALDFESKTSYSVTITVSDTKLTDSITVTINVTDVDENRAPAFTDGTSTTRSIAENTGSGQDIGTAVSATDPDDDDLTYTISGTDAASFSIVSTSGQLRTRTVLDYETKSSYSVTITVTDSKLTDIINVTINVTDVGENRAPSFTEGTSTTRSIAENTGSGQDIGTAVAATDPDNNDLTYTLGGTDAASFSINGITGQLRTNASLNHEIKSSYSVTVLVSDGNGGTDSISVTINVTNVNEAPSFSDGTSTTRSIAENTTANTNIGSAVSATDVDSGTTLTYTLDGTDAASFRIVSTSGQLQTSAALDYETKRSYSVTVTATDDSGASNNSAMITVTISITDVDENRAPSFTGSSISFSISDIASASVGDNIGFPITATDLDEDKLEYSLGGDDAAKFGIDSSSGQLKVTQALIDDTSSSYAIKVIATDPSDATAEISVTITVTRLSTQQQNTNSAPTFNDGASTTRSIAENTASAQNIGNPVSASDSDSGDTLTYTLEGTGAASFSIVSTSGQLQTSAALDYETKSSYSVTVKVTDDSGASNNSTTITVTINVNDVTESEIPSVTITVPSGTQGSYDADGNYLAFEVTVTFSEVVTEFERTELVLAGTASVVVVSMTTTDNITYTLTIEPNGSGTLTFNVAADSAFDTDNNGNTVADEQSVTIDADEPTVELTLPEEPQGSVFTVTITFSEPVNGFDQTDLKIDNVGADWLENEEGSSITDWTASEDRTTYTAEITSTDGMAVYFKVSGRIATDDAGNGNRGTVGKERVFLTIGPPILVSFRYSGHRYLKDPTDAFIVFNESVTGFGKDDLTLSDNTAGATITNWEAKEDGRTYVATVTAETSGEVKLTVPANVATDDDENTNANSKELTLEFDLVAPTITMSTLEGAIINPSGRFQLNVWFSESVAGFRPSIGDDPQEISVTGGTANLEYWTSKINGGHWHFTLNEYFKFRISVDDDATEVVISIDTGAAEDPAGNGNVAASLTLTVTNDANNAPALQIPKTTTLLANYPNPFNPETWIPYQLSKPADVILTIYNMRGVVVRELKLGHQAAGVYTSRNRAIHWDGRNSIGEKVATGMYFYTFTAGDFTATRKMLIRK